MSAGESQMLLPGCESVRLTSAQYAYARVRGRMPKSRDWPDWKCKLMAEGVAPDAMEAVESSQRTVAQVMASRWNRLPGVRREVAREREIALADVRMTADAWWAKVQRLEAMAAGDLPQVRTVAVQAGDGPREIITEEYHETNLSALGKAIEMQGRALAVFVDRAEVSGPDGKPIAVEDAAENAERIRQLMSQAGLQVQPTGGAGADDV